jgi:uncharacterized membrane protein YkoI
MKGQDILVLMALLGVPVFTGADHRNHDDVKRLRDAGEILSLEAITEQYRQSRPAGRILEAELEHEHGRYVYELEILYDDGSVVEMEYDAETGELLEIERKR